MDVQVVQKKLSSVLSGEIVVMSDAELDWLADNDKHPNNMVSLLNPTQMGTKDRYLVALVSHPTFIKHRQEQDSLTSAARCEPTQASTEWDEPNGATTPRGWYWPNGTTKGKTWCAGHYLDYGKDHKRYDNDDTVGSIHCIVVARDVGRIYASRWVETPEQARAWLEAEAKKAGYL